MDPSQNLQPDHRLDHSPTDEPPQNPAEDRLGAWFVRNGVYVVAVLALFLWFCIAHDFDPWEILALVKVIVGLGLVIFIHELGHVWQGYHSAFTWWYVFNSIYYQAACGSGAYDFTAGKQWPQYGAEQQASIVQQWFVNGEQDYSQLYSYMKCNVWPGKPFATTYF